MKLFYTILYSFISLQVPAQSIRGRVLDEKKQPLPAAVVQAFRDGVLIGGNVTDEDGNYEIKPLDTGYCEIVAMYLGYDSVVVTKVPVLAGEQTTINFDLHASLTYKLRFPLVYSNCGGRYICSSFPAADWDNPSSFIYSREEIYRIPH